MLRQKYSRGAATYSRDQNPHHCTDHDIGLYFMRLTQICLNYAFLCFMKFAPVNMDFCLFTAVIDMFSIWFADVESLYRQMLFQ
jgi:hypothetical protein